MTKIKFEADGDRYILSARGHATGSVEVCAAISGILYALAGYLCYAEATEHERRMESADVLLDYSGPERVEAAYAMAMIGLELLEGEYPELIRVEARGAGGASPSPTKDKGKK